MLQQADIKIDEQMIKELNDGMVKCNLITPDLLYIDLSLIKDIYLGTLLTFLTKPEKKIYENEHKAYEYIMCRLEEYRNRSFHDLKHCFPELNFTNDDLDARLNDPAYADFIFYSSPITGFLDTLKAQIAVNVNHSSVIGKKNDIRVIINTYPLILNKQSQHVLGIYMSRGYGLTVQLICQDPRTMSLETLLSYDEVYCFCLEPFFLNLKINKAFSELKFVGKRFYMPKFFGYQYTDQKDIKKDDRYSQTALNVLTQFKYIDMAIVSAKAPRQDPQTDKEETDGK